MKTYVGAGFFFILLGILAIIGTVVANQQTDWIRTNGGLASWLQAIVSVLAMFAVAYPVALQRKIERDRARNSIISTAEMASDLMSQVVERAFEVDLSGSEWWVPQWNVIEEVLASCPIHNIESPEALESFITIRELYGRMRKWFDQTDEPWPLDPERHNQGYVGNLAMNAQLNLEILKNSLQ